MLVYICATLVSVLMAAFASKEGSFYAEQAVSSKYIIAAPKKVNIHCFFFSILSFLPLFLVSALRYNVGMDYVATYKMGFMRFASGGDYKNFEIGFKLINKFVLLFTNDYAGLFIVTSLLFCFFVYRAIYLMSASPAFSVFLLVTCGFYFYSMNAVRQCIATAIFFYAMQYIEKKQFKKYLLWILLASTIHLVALIYIPVYFIGRMKIPLFKAVFFLGVLAAALPLLQRLIYYIIRLTKYSNYINSVYDTADKGFIMPLINILIVLLGYFYQRAGKGDPAFNQTKYSVFLNLQLVATVFSLFLGLFPLAYRLFASFFYCQIFFIPLIISTEKDRNTRLVLTLIIIMLYSTYFAYTIGVQNANTVLPYQTIFDR